MSFKYTMLTDEQYKNLLEQARADGARFALTDGFTAESLNTAKKMYYSGSDESKNIVIEKFCKELNPFMLHMLKTYCDEDTSVNRKDEYVQLCNREVRKNIENYNFTSQPYIFFRIWFLKSVLEIQKSTPA